MKLFADDTKLYRVIEKQEDKLILQDDLCQLCEWSKIWQLRFNIDKCKRMHIGKKEREGERMRLQEVAEQKDLEVIVRSDIKWTEQCSRVIGRATGDMRKLNVSFKYMDAEIFRHMKGHIWRAQFKHGVLICLNYTHLRLRGDLIEVLRL